jgi:hypothetical protein
VALLAPHSARQPVFGHQAFNGAPRGPDPFALQMPPDLPGAIDTQVLLVHPADLTEEALITQCPL